MSKVTIEWRDGNAWKQAHSDFKCTRNNNLAVEHDGTILVFSTLKEGSEVVSPVGGKWVKVGRVTRNHVVFLGEGNSYSETCEQLFKGRGTTHSQMVSAE
jgi:hypothetical protein